MAIADKHWSPQDTLNIRRIISTAVSPDGKRLAFTVMQAEMIAKKNGYLSQIYLAESDGEPPRKLTTGEISSFAPQWSPDGRSIAFLSRNNIWLISLPSGNTRQLTEVPTGVSSFKWSPDGSMIAFTAADDAEPTGEKDGPRIVGQGVKNQRLYLVSLAEISRGPSHGRPLTGSELNVGAPEVPGSYAWSTGCGRNCHPNTRRCTRLRRWRAEDPPRQPTRISQLTRDLTLTSLQNNGVNMAVVTERYKPGIKDMFQIPIVGGGRINPAGDKVVYSLMYLDNFRDNQVKASIHLFDTQTNKTYPFVTEDVISQVRWVDHQTLALLKLAGEAGFQIYIFEGLTGTGQQITDHAGGIETFEPFANGFLYTARRIPDNLAIREGKFGHFKIAGEQESITELYYADRKKMLDYRRNSGRPHAEGDQHTKPVINLTGSLEKPFQIESVTPSPNGDSVFINCRSNEDEFCRDVTDCFRIEFDPDSIFSNEGSPALGVRADRLGLPKGAQVKAISPDGAGMLVLYKEGGPGEHIQSDLWLLDLTIPREALETEDLESHLVCLTKSLDQEPLNVSWTKQGIFISYWNKNNCEIARLSIDGEIEVWDTQGLSPEAFFLNEAAQISLRAASATRLAEIYYGSPASKGWDLKRITSFNEQYSGWDFGTAETIHWTSKDGTEIEGVLRKPSNFDPGKKYPLIFNVHGGPAAVSPLILIENNNRYFYPTVQFLNKDILILEPNYRGSLGRGQEFLALNFDHLGVGDLWDIESAIDQLVAQGFVDETRIGCMGWSQGGYISAFAAMHSNRLKAASAGAALSDWRIYRGGSDEPQAILLSGDPFRNKALFDKSAPISAVQRAQTPILFQHGENDPRVPLISAMEMYRALKASGIQTVLVIFSGQGHGIFKPKECYALMLQNYRWFMHHLMGEELDLLMDDSDETERKNP